MGTSSAPATPRLLWGRLPAQDGTDRLGWVRVEGGRIAATGRDEPGSILRSGVEEVLGGPEAIVCPGFCDLQVNGLNGADAAMGAEAIAEIAAQLPRAGVTSFCPTVITGPLERLVAAPAEAARAATASGPRARVLGIHQEGPFLSERRKGAHDPAYLLAPSPDAIARVVAARPRIVTLAPELPGALDAIARLVAAGIVVSIGHSDATESQARRGFQAGARMATHVFNAMSPLRHREPGVPGAILAAPGVTTGLIADGLHVATTVLELVARLKGPSGIALTCDVVAASGRPPGRYRLGTQVVESDGSRITLADGTTLAGSLATTDVLVRVMAALPGVGPAAAIDMAAATPARLLGESQLGSLRPGAAADLVLLDDRLGVMLTLVGGEVAFRGGDR